MEKRANFISLAVLMPLFFTFLALTSDAAFGQVSPADTNGQTTSSAATITVKIIRDTTRLKNDSLSIDTAGAAIDSLARLSDTTGAKSDTIAAKKDTLQILTSAAGYNTIPGFRVQILTTQDLPEAISMKAKADSLLPSYNIYIVYDSPYYKVRVGDFRARYEANQAVNYIASHGFPNAWSVPDNVFRNPLPPSN